MTINFLKISVFTPFFVEKTPMRCSGAQMPELNQLFVSELGDYLFSSPDENFIFWERWMELRSSNQDFFNLEFYKVLQPTKVSGDGYNQIDSPLNFQKDTKYIAHDTGSETIAFMYIIDVVEKNNESIVFLADYVSHTWKASDNYVLAEAKCAELNLTPSPNCSYIEIKEDLTKEDQCPKCGTTLETVMMWRKCPECWFTPDSF